MWKHPLTQVKFLTVPDIAFILTRGEAGQLQINAGYYNVGICRMMCSRNLKDGLINSSQVSCCSPAHRAAYRLFGLPLSAVTGAVDYPGFQDKSDCTAAFFLSG